MEDAAGDGRDTKRGHPDAESSEEDEGGLGSGGEEESSNCLGPEGPGIRNLWWEHVQYELCEGTCIDSHGYCSEWGVWTGSKYDIQQSEAQAAVLLNKGGKISRTDVNRLLELSMTTWKPTSRQCDRQAAVGSAQGWTLGAYIYGNKVGVTRETYRRPLLTQFLNQHVRQEAPTAHWAALRVTCDFQASPHRDKNEPGSENVIVPVSWFKRGNLWVEGECKLGCILSQRDVDSKIVEGYIDGGADRVCAFNPRLRHAVEPAEGKRWVLVAYTPRLLDRLPPLDLQFLADVSFPRGERMEADPKGGEGVKEQHTSISTGNLRKESTQESLGEEEFEVGVAPGGDGSNQAEWMEPDQADLDMWESAHHTFMQLRGIEMSAQKHLDEELDMAASVQDDGQASHGLELKNWLRDFEEWLIQHDALGQLSSSMLGAEEVRVLKARLCHLGVQWEGDAPSEEYDQEIPLSGEPLIEDDGIPSASIHEATERWQATPAGPLQTVTIRNKEFLENLEEWRPSAEEELGSIFDSHRALRRVTQHEVDALVASGVVVEIIPAKAIFQRKAGSGRHKTRVVACRNFEAGASHRSNEKKLSH